MKKFLALMMALALLCTSMMAFATEADGDAVAAADETQTGETPAESEEETEPAEDSTQTSCGPHHEGVEDAERYVAPTCTEAGKRYYKCSVCGEEYSVEIPATGHQEGADHGTEVVKEPTCTEEGELKHFHCAVCGQDWTTVMEKVPHTYGDVVTVPADCTHDEESIKTCKVCGHEEVTVAKGTALGHDWEDQPVTKLPSCTEKGSAGTAKVCERCGITDPDTLKDVVEIDELDHQSWLEDNEDKFFEIEYDENGEIWKVFVSDEILDDQREWDAVEDKDGRYGALKAEYKAPTCTEDGLISVYCTECDAEISTVIPALGHELEPTVEGAIHDCRKVTSVLYECVNPGCDYKFNQVIEPAKDHTFEKEIIVGYKQKKAADGELVAYGADEFDKIAECCDYYVTMKCDVDYCKCTRDFLVEGNGKHKADDYIIKIEPTCTEPGRELYNCRYCGWYQDESIPASGHSDNLAYVKTLVEPDCTHTGVRLVKCTREGCDYTEEQVIPALGHHYVYTEIPADCKNGVVGQKIGTCVKCGERVVVEEWSGHEAGEIVAHKDPKCTEDGSTSFWCKHCHKLVTETEDALGHDWEEVETIPATCKTGKESGRIHKYVCTRCGAEDIKVDDDVPAGHTMFNEDGGLNKFVVKTLPTCETAGKASYVCAVCGELIEDFELAPISHNTVVTFNEKEGVYEATCEKLAKSDTGRLEALLLKAGYNEKVAKAVVEMMAKTSGSYFAGIGCDHVEKIEIKKTEYDITSSGSRGRIELKEGCQAMKGDAYVRITWRYTLANGDTVGFTTCREVREDGTFKLTGLSAPEGSTCDFIYVEVVNDPDADEMSVGEYTAYGAKSL